MTKSTRNEHSLFRAIPPAQIVIRSGTFPRLNYPNTGTVAVKPSPEKRFLFPSQIRLKLWKLLKRRGCRLFPAVPTGASSDPLKHVLPLCSRLPSACTTAKNRIDRSGYQI